MTKELYHIDSYLKEFSAHVLKIDEENNAILLDQTAFFPGGGGQVPDSGTIKWGGQISPLDRAKHSPDGILHILEKGSKLPPVGAEYKAMPPQGEIQRLWFEGPTLLR